MIDFKGSHFECDVILWGRPLVCGVSDQLTPTRRNDGRARRRGRPFHAQPLGRQYAPLLEKQFRAGKRAVGSSWRLDETYVKVKGCWKYLYRTVDKAARRWISY